MTAKRIIISILFIVFGLIIAYVVLDPEKKELTETTRLKLGGFYVRLPQGVTHYSLEGPESGRVVVLVHGATIPMFCWDELSPALAKAGFRVLRYDMYGRGYSDRPKAVYNREFYRGQLQELLDTLEIREPVDLIGVSMGAGTICDFSVHYPERVGRIGFIAPVVNDINAPYILKLPILGELAMRFIGLRQITKRALSLTDRNSPLYERQAALFSEQTSYQGFQTSFLSMMRNAATADYRDSYQALGKQKRRTILIWGTQDMDISEDKINLARDLIPNLEYHAIEKGTHGILSRNFEQVQDLLIHFLQQN